MQGKVEDATLLVVGQTLSSFKSTCKSNLLSTDKIILFESKRNSLYGKNLSIIEVWNLHKLLKQFDVILTHQLYNFQNIYLVILARINKKPFVLMPHGTMTTYQKKQHRIRKLFVDFLFFNAVKKNCSGIAVATDIEHKQMSARLRNKSRNIGIGFSLNSKAQVGKDRDGSIAFAFLGRLAEVKRVDLTIAAFKIFSDAHPNSKLEIIGNGEHKIVNDLKHLSKDLHLEERITFHGWLDSAEKTKVLQKCSFLVLNSENENFGIAAVEAQSLGIPVLVTKFVGYSEVVKRYKTGFVIKSLDIDSLALGMKKLAESPYLDLSRNSLLAAKQLVWSEVIKNWINFLEEESRKSKQKTNVIQDFQIE
jgi:glycosyltransferase involved in cell wall biosynthesis